MYTSYKLLYASSMKRLQILIDEDLNEGLEQLAGQEKTSKAALIRKFVRERLQPPVPLESDPLWQMAGVDDFEPGDHDEIVYGPPEIR